MSILKSHENIFKDLKPELLKLGFTYAEYQSHFCSIDFRKNSSNVSDHIRIEFYNDSIELNTIQGNIVLNDVNRIFEKFVDLVCNNEFFTVNNYENKSVLSNEKIRLNSILRKNDKSIYLIELIDHIKNFILPFFEKYPDIVAINEKILNQVPEKDYPEWIHGQSTLKILIIMKLCGNPKYEEYKTTKEKEYLAFVNQNPDMWKPAYDTFITLMEYLDSGKYKELL